MDRVKIFHSPKIRRTQSKAFYKTPLVSELLLTMSATQPIDTNNARNTDNQITQRANSMDLDNLLSHTAKKVKATLSEETSATTLIELLPTQTASTQNDEKLKIPQDTSIPK
ncbi:32109_t:CDS:2 [Gigaspora margarita]|uniref:32109_t:CDS:1 n=1 Tax=Gigaspora margarita TaxID=4874 RepID=A0ABM8VY68_GIGMA|nr:32109_t:CDS:2 [Gigaspora margarita]